MFSNVLTVQISVAGDNVCNPLTLELGNNGPFTNSGATSEIGEIVPLVIHTEANLNGVTVQERKIRFGLPSPQRCRKILLYHDQPVF